MEREPVYRSVLAVDIERSAGRGDPALLAIREVLRTTLRESFARCRIDWDACRVDDLGDGLRVTAPPGVRKAVLVHPLLDEVAARLRAHNRLAGPATAMRVRMALHAGDLWFGPSGEVAGRPLEVLARLLDAPAVRTALAGSAPGTVAALVLSQHFHEETVAHGYPGTDPEAFREVEVRNKEFTARAWLRLAAPPDAPSDAVPDAAGDPARNPASTESEDPASASAQDPETGRDAESARDAAAPYEPRPAVPSRMTNTASGHGVIYATQNGDQHITVTRTP
ncbi:hypothetical protein [Actinacidiphila acidipaludis]|uniref:Uncharacterized protein n=1 Tax=Actinacidiphila acidipaludis TaxID=2873382 RepID=A0ABS7QG95_9ACTN|nr:hypothetical protein [Streptomyces acidipaludis]MBY8882177.1 hypothetical protein [Streptomyces acidipaludis]